jgi:hypothetical protein
MKPAIKIIGIIIFIGVATMAIIMTVKFISTNTELTSTKGQLAVEISLLAEKTRQLTDTQLELTLTRTELTGTRDDLTETILTLDDTRTELFATEKTLATTQTQLAGTQTKLSSTESILSSTESNLSDTKSELQAYKTTMEGMGITVYTQNKIWNFNYKSWTQENNSKAGNPTWAELVAFIDADTTNQHTYDASTYNCVNYAVDVHNNAENAGITAAVVTVLWNGEPVGHAINAFITSDYGLVFVDCTSGDKVAYVVKDKVFKELDFGEVVINNYRNNTWWANLTSYYYIPSTFARGTGQATTESIGIYW